MAKLVLFNDEGKEILVKKGNIDPSDADYMEGEYIEAQEVAIKALKILEGLKEKVDNLETYTIHTGAAQPDKVCVEYKEVKKLLNTLEEGI